MQMMFGFLIMTLILSPTFFYAIKTWKPFLYYSLSILVLTYILGFYAYIDILDPCIEGNGLAEAIGLLIFWAIVIWIMLNLLIRLSFFIVSSIKDSAIRREILSFHTAKAFFYSIIFITIWSVFYCMLNNPFKPYVGDTIVC